jgi:ABC-type multidrug transport system ATPase subunit
VFRTAIVHRLELDDVSKSYGHSVQAVRGISLTLGPGITGLLGPNGAGKSTLMRILATVTKPTAGTVRWDGIDIVKTPLAARKVLGYLPQDAGVYPHLNAREFLSYIAALKQLEPRFTRAQIERLLEALDLMPVAKRPLGTLSGGNRQRVAIAQALLGDPHLLIVDEPTAGLDPEQRVRFRDLLSELARERVVILSTHVVSDVETSADRIVIVAAGRILADAPRVDLLAKHGSLERAYLETVGAVA